MEDADTQTASSGELRQNVTIRDVAERAGVSIMTVSRVMNSSGVVRPDTKQRVEDAIRALNYRPNLGARRLAGGKSLFIGMLYHNPSPNYLSKILYGSLEACREGGHHLVLNDLGQLTPYTDPEATARSLNLADLDGLIVSPPVSSHQPFMDVLARSGLPIINVAPGDLNVSGLKIAMDDARAMEEMVTLVLDHRHTRIGFIKGPPDHPSSGNRFNGFKDGLARRNLTVDPDLVKVGDFTYRSGFECATELLSRPDRPTVIMTSNDDMAAGTIAAAYRMGLRVPEDLSVTGFDDTEIATNIWPELTTVKQPIAEMASRAVRLLTANKRGDKATLQSLSAFVDHVVVVRDTLKALNP